MDNDLSSTLITDLSAIKAMPSATKAEAADQEAENAISAFK